MYKIMKLIALSIALVASVRDLGAMENQKNDHIVFGVMRKTCDDVRPGIVCVWMKREKNNTLVLPTAQDFSCLIRVGQTSVTLIGTIATRGSWSVKKDIAELLLKSFIWVPIADLQNTDFTDIVLQEKLQVDGAIIEVIKNAWNKAKFEFTKLFCGAVNKQYNTLEEAITYEQLVDGKSEKDEKKEKSEKEKKLDLIKSNIQKEEAFDLVLEIDIKPENVFTSNIKIKSMRIPAGFAEAMGANKVTIDKIDYYTVAPGNPNLVNTKKIAIAEVWEPRKQDGELVIGYDQNETEPYGDLYKNTTLEKIIHFHQAKPSPVPAPKNNSQNKNNTTSSLPSSSPNSNQTLKLGSNAPSSSSSSSSSNILNAGTASFFGGLGIFGAYELYKWLQKSGDKK